MAVLSIRLFGGLTIEYDGEDRTSSFSGRLRVLLTFLVLQANLPQSRQAIAFTLWPESSEKQARTNLRKLVLLLRAALGPSANYLVITDNTLCWRSDEPCWIDSATFAHRLTAANKATTAEAIELLTAAVDLYRGDLLPDCYDEWILAPRESLRDRYINALTRLSELFEAQGRYAEGVAAARRLLQHDPVYERGHLQLIRLQALMNDRAGALQSYHRCATLMRRELGVDPSPMMEELYLQLLDPHITASLPAVERTRSIPLIGRRSAWQQLLSKWQQAQAGAAQFVLIVGEAGIGKSRLAEEMMGWVERQGNVAAHARAYSSDNRTLTCAPIAGLLRVPTIHSEVTRLQPYWLTEIARLLPELLLEREDIRPPQPMVDDWQRHHLFAALTQALQPKRRPRLLVIDDLQWCDSETLAWLPHLLDHAQTERLLVIGTVRSEEFDDYDALQTLCETLRRHNHFNEIVLGPLDATEIAELARHVVGRSLAEPQAQWLVGATEGNPLFVIESARLFHDDSILAKLPQSVLAVIEARLARLSKAARSLAETAATIGRSFTLPVLAAAAALDEAQLVDALDELWRRRIIRERESDAYDFTHDRIRDGAYAGISKLRRRLIHKRVATAILQTQRAALDEMSGQLGYHYEEANDHSAAIEQYLRAAAVAAAQYAHPETLHYLDRVLTLAQPAAIALRFDTLLRRDRLLEISGTHADREANIQQLRQLAEADEADVKQAIRRRALTAERASRAAVRLNNSAHGVAHARQAVEYADRSDDASVQALCHYTLGLRYWFIGNFADAIPHLEQAIALARQTEDSDILASALEARAQTYMFNGGEASTIEALMEECLFHYEKVGNLLGRSQILNKIGYLQFAQGTGIYAGACDVLRQSIAITQEMSALQAEVAPQRNLAITYTCMGNYAAADACLLRAQANYASLGQMHDDPVLLNYRGFLYLSEGRLADALAMQQQALAGLTATNHRQWRVKALTALAWITMRLQKAAEAMAFADNALAESQAINEQRQVAYTLIVRGILHVDLRDFANARRDFADARSILHAFKMANRALEAEAGLAYLALLEGEMDKARCDAHAILTHLEEHPVDFTEDVCQLLLSCYHIFHALDPVALPRLNPLIELHLSTRTATLNAATQKLFWQIPAHQTLRQALAQRNHPTL